MSMIEEKIGTRNLGFILLGIAVVCLVIGVIVIWTSINRWRGISELNRYFLAALERDGDEAEQAAKRAADLQPDHAATVLPSTSAGSDSDLLRLQHVSQQGQPSDRVTVDSMRAFVAAQKEQQSPVEATGSDGTLIKRMAAAGKGDLQLGALSKDQPPHFAILSTVLQRQFQVAWSSGNREALKTLAGQIALLHPKHKDAARLKILTGAFDKDYPAAQLKAQVDSSYPTPEERNRFIRQLCVLSPERRNDLVTMIPDAQRTSDEMQSALLNANETLDNLVTKAISSGSPVVMRDIARRCLAANKIDLAKRLAGSAPADLQKEMKLAIAMQEGDLATLAKLGGDRPELKAKITKPVGIYGLIAFHLATGSGLIPHAGELEIETDGKPVTADRLTRFGSLIAINMLQTGSVHLEIKLDKQSIFSDMVEVGGDGK